MSPKVFTSQDLEYITKLLTGNGVPERTVDLVKLVLLNRRIPSSWFVDEYHYWFYRRYVKPKLGRMKTLVVSRNGEYVIVDVDTGRKYDNIHSYLIGFDSQSNKLFVNHVLDMPVSPFMDYVDVNGVRVIVAEPSDIKNTVLGYDFDLDREEYDVIDSRFFARKRDAWFRVQGDVVLYVCRVSDLRGLYRVVMDRDARSQLWDLLWLYVCNLIARRLQRYRIAARVGRRGGHVVVAIPSVIRRGADDSSVKRYLRAVAEVVKEALHILGPEGELRVVCFDYAQCYVKIDDFQLIRVEKAVGGEWGNPYVDMIIERFVWCYDTITKFAVFRKVLRYVDEQINEFAKHAEPRIYTHRIGDHVIQVPSLPRRIAIPIPDEYFDIELQNTVIAISRPEYFVPRGSEIVLYHDQHGRKVIRLDVDAIIGFDTTRVHEMHSAEVSRIALQLLARKLGI